MSNFLSGLSGTYGSEVATGRRARACSALPTWRLRRVQAHIETRLFDQIYAADLAQVAGLSQMHFSAQFRTAMGVSPHAYIVQRRVEAAQQLMRDERRSIVSIALEVGFSNQAHFSRAFKKLAGKPPRIWRLDLFNRLSSEESRQPMIANQSGMA